MDVHPPKYSKIGFDTSPCVYYFYHSKPSRIAFLVHPKWVYGAFLSHGGTPKIIQNLLSGWWYTYPSEIYESQLGWWFPIYGKKTCFKPPTSYYRKTNGLGYQYPTFQCPKTAFFTGQGSKKPSRHSHRKVPASSIRRLLRVSWPAHFWPRDIIIWWYTYPSEKYEFVSCDDEIPNIWKNNKCSKPPTSDGIIELSNCKIEVSCVLLCMNSY